MIAEIGVIFTIAIAVAGFVYIFVSGKINVSNRDTLMELDARIIEAYERRISQLETDVHTVREENSRLQGEIKVLKQYQAPHLVERFEKSQEQIITLLQSLVDNIVMERKN